MPGEPIIREARDEAGAIVARLGWQDGAVHGVVEAGGPGQPRTTMTFVQGVAEGPMTLRDAQRRVTTTATLAAGKLEGPMTLFDPATGKPVRRLHYRAGQLLREEPLTLMGRLVALLRGTWP